MIKTIGQSGQISLGKQFAGRQASVEEIEAGVWVIRLGQFIPDSERWLWENPNKAKLDQAINWAEQHPPATTDVDALEKSLKQQQ